MNKLMFDKLGVLISTTGTVYNVETLKEFIDYVSKIGYNTLKESFSDGQPPSRFGVFLCVPYGLKRMQK